MKNDVLLAVPFACLWMLMPVFAQDGPPLSLGGFEVQGTASVGYRFTDISGRQEKFQELFNLRSGPRLLDFNFVGNAKKEGSARFADSFQFWTSGLGGDPFPAAQLSVSKSKVYDLRVNYRQSYYYWDRNDNAIQPSGLHALTGNHNWATVRKFGSLNLLVHASNRLKFRFEYGRNSRDGVNDSTRTLEYFGSPSTWGTFLRDNPYYVEAPLTERTHRVAGGVDYSLDHWSFHYTLGYQTFDQAMDWHNPVSPERSINIDSTANVKELLNTSLWRESRSLSTPSSEFLYNGRLNSRVELRGDFLFFRYQGPSTLNADFQGLLRANSTGTSVTPYSISLSSRGQLTEPNYVVDQGATFKLTEWSNLHVDYRFNRFTERSTATQHSLFNITPFDGKVVQDWSQDLHQLDVSLELTPLRSLVIRPGVRLVDRDTTNIEDGVLNPTRSEHVKTAWPMASVAYIPSPKFSIRADVQSITNGASYTRITPHTDVGSRWIARYKPTKKLSIEENFVIRNRKLVQADFRNRIRSNAATVSWAWTDRFSTFAGFSYDSFLATASVVFLRGTAPLNTTWRDQTVNRVWQAGVTAQPTRRLGISFTGNFVRSTGAGEISGEPPTFGPMTFPMATGTVSYDFPKAGRLSIDLQRTYYFEEIIRGNDFQANLLTLRWTRGF